MFSIEHFVDVSGDDPFELKRTQRADIDRAIKRWKLWQREGRT
ncbi:MAG: hypothetical protein RIR28_514 [Pseudomonadota bacterium]